MLSKRIKNAVTKSFLGAALLAGTGLWSQASFAQGHAYINYMRSSTESHVFVQQSVEGEYGKIVSNGTETDESGNTTPTSESQFWKGYGIGTTIGLEVMKFVQFTAGHTFVNLRYRDDALQRLTGSRLNAGMKLVFLAPIGNLEAGAGVLGSRLDYQKELDNGSLYGSGLYYSLGVNYFMNSRVSLFGEAKSNQEHLVRNGGATKVSSMDSTTTLMGFGFRIWL